VHAARILHAYLARDAHDQALVLDDHFILRVS
jgi:hypothetical protein